MAKTSKNNRRITGVKSSTLALFEGVLFGAFGLGVAILHSLRTTVEYTEHTESLFAGLAFGVATGIVSIIVLPLVYFGLGWILGYVHGFIFNVIAENSDGIVLRMEDAKE